MTEGDLLEATSEDPGAADPRLGAEVGRYSIVRLIGRGGMGTVYEARHTRLGRRVAIKFLLPKLAARPEILRRFENEAVAAGGLEHPNLVAVIDLGGAADGEPYLVMEFLEGQDCARLLAQVGPLPAPRAADIVLQACRGVAIAHASGIIHRDLKPENLFVTDAGDGGDLVKVLDFGIAKLRPLDGQLGTRTGATLGTTHYMSPEQARGAGEIDLRADVWSLGVVLYELLAGRKPYEGEDFLNIVHQILSAEPPPLGTLRPGLPAGLEAAVARAMRKEPGERFRSVAAFAAAIQPFAGRVAAPRPVASPTAVTIESTAPPTAGTRPPAVRRRVVGTILAIGAAAMATTFVIGGGSFPGKALAPQRVSSAPTAAPSTPAPPPAPVKPPPSLAEAPAEAPVETAPAPRRRLTAATRPRPPATLTARATRARRRPTPRSSWNPTLIDVPKPVTSLRSLPLLALAASIALVPRVARGEDPKAAAHDHFDRGLAASQEQRFDDAAREFEAAYALAPDFKVLYNIGRVSILLGRPVRAVEALESYLAEGGDRLSEERREEARRLIDGQLPKVATLGIETAPGADVRVDGKLVGQAPLTGRVRVTAGAHTVEALLPGRPPQLREVTLEGASTTDLSLVFPLAPPPATRTSGPAAPVVVAPVPEPPRRRRVAAYVTGGVGLLALVGGAALAFESALAANDARGRMIAAATPATPTPADLAKYDAAKVTYEDARTRNQLGWAIAGVGGLAVLTAAVLVYTSPVEASPTTSHAHLVAGPGAIALRGTW